MKVPPGSVMVVGRTDLSSEASGRTSLNTIVSESVAVSSLASSSTALAVNVLTWLTPASPLTVRVIVKSQLAKASRTVPTLQSASPLSGP